MQRSHSRSALGIQQVAKMAFDSCGSELSYRKIAAIAGLGVDTVKHYLEACAQAYLLFACPYFAFSEKKRLVRHKKYYAIDPAMRYAITGTHGRDFGKSLALLVYLRLRQTHEQVFYWQEAGKGEVDFVTLEGQIITPYQAEPRHHQALNAFYERFPHAEEAVWVTSENATAFLIDDHLPN